VRPVRIRSTPAGTLELLKTLVAIDSVNPSLVAGGAGEREIATFVASWARDSGLETDVLERTPGRPSVVVRDRWSIPPSTLATSPCSRATPRRSTPPCPVIGQRRCGSSRRWRATLLSEEQAKLAAEALARRHR
jgi:hypothetical protein